MLRKPCVVLSKMYVPVTSPERASCCILTHMEKHVTAAALAKLTVCAPVVIVVINDT